MAERDGEHSGHPVLRALATFLVLALVAGGVAAWRLDLVDDWFDDPAPDRSSGPAAVPPPRELDLPEVEAPPVVADPVADDARLDPAAVRKALGRYLRDRDLGKHVLALVAPLDGDGPTYALGQGRAIPASTTKVVTSVAALFALGGDHVFETTVVRDGRRGVVLVGGGDPLLASKPADASTYPERADVVTLAERAARTLRKQGTTTVRLGYDAGLFTGPAENPHWRPDYVPDAVVSPTSALWVDEGRPASGYGRVADPAAAAAETFAAALTRAGINVRGAPRERSARPDARPIATVTSAPLEQIVERVLLVSDNEASEVLHRHVGIAQEGEGSVEAGSRGVRRVLEALGVPLRGSVLYDGSGLSRDNRLDPRVLVDLIRLAADDEHPELRAVVTGLPVAGFTGSLTDRMDQGPRDGLGRVRAKTGTLTNVASLAGVATDVDGTAMAFVLMADRIRANRYLFARVAMDSAAAALGACHCGR